ncbi:MAG: hypothetical protein E6J88_15300 [Deltaproteobacteria bacterium]|nr:MAG: hypothetical protein E6J88_15300 [Deltaproteobacteria bacterium]
MLIKFAGEQSSITEKIIMGGQSAVKKLSGLFHSGIKKGDPTCFHVAVYLGGGKTAEAHGGDLSTARVGTRSFDEHAGFLFQVYRCKDQALDFGKNAGTAGGPPDFGKMFCSEFVIAVYQAAVVARQIKKKSKLKAGDVSMPPGLDLHASNSSPLAFDAKLVEGCEKKTWEHVAEVLVRPQEQGGADAPAAGPAGADVTSHLVTLGNPTRPRWASGNDVYARNPWSLRVFDGKLHVASGNSNNKGPAPNVGPIDLWAWDPKTGKFGVEYVVADEQVDLMHKLDDGLYIPGHDSHLTGRRTSTLEKALSVPADWAYGNMHHRKPSGAWEQNRTIVNGIHVYDVIQFNRKLFAAVSTLLGGTVARSEDGGKSWHEMFTYEKPGERTRSLFVLGGKLHASTTGGRIYVWDGGKKMNRISANFFPNLENEKELFAARPTAFNGQVAYIAGRKLIDHDWTPEGLFIASPPDSVRAAPLPGRAMPRDFLVDSGKIYALASTPIRSRARSSCSERTSASGWGAIPSCSRIRPAPSCACRRPRWKSRAARSNRRCILTSGRPGSSRAAPGASRTGRRRRP